MNDDGPSISAVRVVGWNVRPNIAGQTLAVTLDVPYETMAALGIVDANDLQALLDEAVAHRRDQAALGAIAYTFRQEEIAIPAASRWGTSVPSEAEEPTHREMVEAMRRMNWRMLMDGTAEPIAAEAAFWANLPERGTLYVHGHDAADSTRISGVRISGARISGGRVVGGVLSSEPPADVVSLSDVTTNTYHTTRHLPGPWRVSAGELADLGTDSIYGQGAPAASPEAVEAHERAVQAVQDAITAKVEKALDSGRRVNVVELGRYEQAVLCVADGATMTALVDGVVSVPLVVRLCSADEVISLYHDPAISPM